VLSRDTVQLLEESVSDGSEEALRLSFVSAFYTRESRLFQILKLNEV